MATDRLKNIIKRHEKLKSDKSPWNEHYQLIGEFIMTRKQNFDGGMPQGAFLTKDLFDNTAQKANAVMASILVGMLWPNGAKSFRMLPPDGMPESGEVKKYFEFVTRKMAEYMDDTRSGLNLSLNEYMLDQGAFGTSGIAVFEKDTYPYLQYKAWDVKSMCIIEGPDGYVDSIYNEVEMTIRNAVKKYGMENLSKSTQESFMNGKDSDTIRILHVIEPRMDRDPNSFGNQDMPIASIHIELKAEHVINESGFEEMPVFVTRFYKAMGEEYGRSPGMIVLPDVIELNAIWEATTIAIEKQVNPPLAIMDDGRLGNAVINTSAGALNVFNTVGGLSSRDMVFPIFTVGEIKSIEVLIDKLEKSITDAFSIDRLLDLNNDTRMTLGEAQIRNQIRADSLSSMFIRQEAELFNPMIGRTFNLLLARGILGTIKGSDEEAKLLNLGIPPYYIPDVVLKAMQKQEEVFKIQYISPAARMRIAEELKGIVDSFQFAVESASVAPEVLDNLDSDAAMKKFHEISAGSTELLRAKEDIDQMRAARQQQREQMAQLANAREASEVSRNMAQAQSMQVGAQQTVAKGPRNVPR